MPMFSLDFGYNKSGGGGHVKRSLSRSYSDETLRGSLKKQFGQPYYKSQVEASGKLDFGELELELYDSRYMLRRQREPKWSGWCRPSCVPISIILVLIVLVVVLSLLDQKLEENRIREKKLLNEEWARCRNSCIIELVESIPDGLTYNSSVKHTSTYQGWLELLELAKESIEIGSFYWNLRDDDYGPSWTKDGNDVFDKLMTAGSKRGISVKIAQNLPSKDFPNTDTAKLVEAGAAEVRSLNFSKLMGSGVLHTKMWVVDRQHAYLGSANIDWKSLTQVKELGILVKNCSCFAKDLGKIFDVYWELGQNDSEIPSEWPSSFNTLYGKENPMNISINGSQYYSYFTSSPPPFCPKGRTNDIDGILDVISNATEFVHISVMDYSPSIEFSYPPKFWPLIDDALRKAAVERKVEVKLLISLWSHTKKSTYNFLRSLQDLNNVYSHVKIEIKMFKVPADSEQKLIPFARVNHNKYMVTDKSAYIGTSNWSGDYFVSTGGVGFIITPTNGTNTNNLQENLHDQVKNIFIRDWTSSYAHPLNESISTEFVE